MVMAAAAAVEGNAGAEGEGVLVAQLVRAAAARFRVHSLAVRHHAVGDPGQSGSSSSSVFSSWRGGSGTGLFIGGSGGSGWTGTQGQGQRLPTRPASAGSDELGLPPLKLVRKDRRGRRPREAGAAGGEVEEEVDVFGVPRPRSTPRCLRPGYKVPFEG